MISQATKIKPVPSVALWLQSTPTDALHLSVITIQEVRAGAEALPMGQKRTLVERWLEDHLIVNFQDRILPVDTSIANLCGRLVIRSRQQGKIAELGDALIAATALIHGMKLATLNRKNYVRFGVDLVDF